MSELVWNVIAPDFEWGDLPADEEAARIAAKNPYGPRPPVDLVLQTPRGRYRIMVEVLDVPVSVPTITDPCTHRYGVLNHATMQATWAPIGSEGKTRPDVTVRTVRDLCGVVELERKVASLESQVRTLHAAVHETRSQRVGVFT